ncbi:MAG: hypothetical protein M1608_00180 [Candidatus Omnitrophica bacterium]|nr:hypothetical protein [Candidatus Omnitrophota bacterium]
MFRAKKEKEHRYYLLPGMGRSNRRHRRLVFRWSLAVGVIFSLFFAALLYFLNRR